MVASEFGRIKYGVPGIHWSPTTGSVRGKSKLTKATTSPIIDPIEIDGDNLPGLSGRSIDHPKYPVTTLLNWRQSVAQRWILAIWFGPRWCPQHAFHPFKHYVTLCDNPGRMCGQSVRKVGARGHP